MGDVIFATPAIRSLKIAYPKYRLAVMMRRGFESLLQGNPHVDEIIPYADGEYVRIVGDLARRPFTTAILLDRDERMAQMVYQARIPARIGYDRPASMRFLTKPIPRTEQGTSEIHWSVRLAYAAGGKPVDEKPELFVREDEIAAACRKFELPHRNYVVIHPGSDSSAAYKRWSTERFAAVARQLQEKKMTVVVTGVTSERRLGRFFRKQNAGKILLGDTTLRELVHLIAGSRLVITNDTGPAHIAAALERPCVAVTGFADPKIYHPYGGPHRYLYRPISCSPCFGRTMDPADCLYMSCLKMITVDDVLSAASELLAK